MISKRRAEQDAREELRRLTSRRRQIDKAIAALEELQVLQWGAPKMQPAVMRTKKEAVFTSGTRRRCVAHRVHLHS